MNAKKYVIKALYSEYDETQEGRQFEERFMICGMDEEVCSKEELIAVAENFYEHNFRALRDAKF